jgi:hypothetical protein
MDPKTRNRTLVLILAMIAMTAASTRTQASQSAMCGGQTTVIPFDDVMPANVFFCSIAQAYFSGLSNGTDTTHYSPSSNVPREQMAAFVTRTMDQSLKRGSKRAALDQYWTSQTANNIALTTVGMLPRLVKSDGVYVWVANFDSNTVSQVRAIDGALIGTWTGATTASGVVCAMAKVFAVGGTPGKLYQIDPLLPVGPVTVLSSSLGNVPTAIAYDGQRLWTANSTSISIITFNPVTVTNVSTGFSNPQGLIYDGANMWLTDNLGGSVDKIHKLDSTGTILLSVDVGNTPVNPAFDGTNIWVPNFISNNVTVVRAVGSLAGTVLATLSGNGLTNPVTAAFDGERVLVTDQGGTAAVSLFKASDFTPIVTNIGSTGSFGACSDGLNFWFTQTFAGKLARF